MKRITWFILLLASILWLTYVHYNYSEAVSIIIPQWGLVEAQPSKLILFILATFLVISATIWLWFALIDRYNSRHKNTMRRRQARANKDLIGGIMHFAAGDYPAAQTQLLKNADYSPISGLNHLIVARAQHEQGKLADRDKHLLSAAAQMPDEQIVITLAQAQMQIESGQITQANQAIDQALDNEPDNEPLSKLKFRALHDLQHWEEIYHWIVTERIHLEADLRQTYLLESLQHILPTAKHQRIEAMVKELGIRHSQNQIIVSGFIGAISDAYPALALQLSGDYLNDYWSPSVATLYSQLNHSQPSEAITTLNQWRDVASTDPQFHHAMARFYLQNNQTQQAVDAYSQSLQLQRNATVLHEALTIHTQAGDHQAAAEMFLNFYHPLDQYPSQNDH